MASKYKLYSDYPAAKAADSMMDALIGKFNADVGAWLRLNTAGGASDTAVREAVWQNICRQFAVFGVRQTIVKPDSAIGDDPPPHNEPEPAPEPDVPQVNPRPPAKLPAVSPTFLFQIWQLAKQRPWTKALFFIVFIIAATFYFKDKRLAEEAGQVVPPIETPPALKAPEPVHDPDQPPPGWEKMSDEELGKMGFKRITREEFDKMVLVGTTVVEKGHQESKGFRVAYTEDDWAFIQSVPEPNLYYAYHFSNLERKLVPMPMPPGPAKQEPIPDPKPVEPPGPVVRPRPKVQ